MGPATPPGAACWLMPSRPGHEVVLTREPSGAPIGEAIRGVRTEALLFAAARAQHAFANGLNAANAARLGGT